MVLTIIVSTGAHKSFSDAINQSITSVEAINVSNFYMEPLKKGAGYSASIDSSPSGNQCWMNFTHGPNDALDVIDFKVKMPCPKQDRHGSYDVVDLKKLFQGFRDLLKEKYPKYVDKFDAYAKAAYGITFP